MARVIYDTEKFRTQFIPAYFLQDYINLAMFLVYDRNGLEALCNEIE